MARKSQLSGKPERKRSSAQEEVLRANKWPPGFCPNLNGRPRDPVAMPPPPGEEKLSAARIIIAEAHEHVRIMESGKSRKMTRIEAARRKHFNAVMAGARHTTSYIEEYERACVVLDQWRDARRREFEEASLGRAHWIRMIEGGGCTLEYREPDLYDPRDIVFDLEKLEIIRNGPIGHEAKADWKVMRDRRRGHAKGIRLLKRDPDLCEEDRNSAIEESLKIIRYIDGWFPDRRRRRQEGFNLETSRAVSTHEWDQKTEARRRLRAKDGKDML